MDTYADTQIHRHTNTQIHRDRYREEPIHIYTNTEIQRYILYVDT